MGKRIFLKGIRLNNGDLSQADIAKRCGVTRNAYSKIERGESDGSPEFWLTLKDKFCLTAEEAWRAEYEKQ